MSRLLRRFFSVAGAVVGTTAIGFVIQPLFVRLLGSADYGNYATVMSALSLSMVIVNSGIFDGLRKFIPENEDVDWISNVFAFYFRLGILLVSITGVLLFTVQWFVPVATIQALRPFLLVFVAMLLGDQLLRIVRGTLMGLRLERYSEPLTVLRKLLFGTCGALLAFAGWGAIGPLIGYVFASLLVGAIGIAVIRDELSLRPVITGTTSGFPRSKLLTYNVNTTILLFLTVSLYHVDVLLLRVITDASTAGYYNAALVVAGFLWVIPRAAQFVLLPSASALWADYDRSEISHLSSQAARHVFLFTMLLVCGVYILADPFFQLYYGTEYLVATTPLKVLLPGVLFFAVARPIFAVGQGNGNLRPLIIATGASSAVNVLLNLALIPTYGMTGAAAATSVGYGSMLLFHSWAAKELGYNPLSDLRSKEIAITAAITMFGLYFFAQFVTGTLSLLILPPIGGVIYTSIAYFSGAVDDSEVQRVRTWASKLNLL